MKWNKVQKPIDELIKFHGNPRQINKEQALEIERSIDKFGLCDPIICNTDGMIIGGHQRLEILKKLGYKKVDVMVPEYELKFEDCRELNIRLNKNQGNFDYDILANEWEVDDLLSYGFKEEELTGTFEQLEPEESPKKQKKKSKFQLICYFCCENDVEDAHDKVMKIIQDYPGVKLEMVI